MSNFLQDLMPQEGLIKINGEVSVSAIIGVALKFLGKRVCNLYYFLARKEYRKTKTNLLKQSMYYNLFSDNFKHRVKSPYFEIKTDFSPAELDEMSYVVIGNGGEGKTSFLVNDFNGKQYSQFEIKYYNAEDITSFTQPKNNRSKKVILYLDGLDEIGDDADNLEKIKELLKFYSDNTGKAIYKISCRKDFFYRHIEDILDELKIKPKIIELQSKSEGFMEFLLENLKKDLKEEFLNELNAIEPKDNHYKFGVPVFDILYVYGKIFLEIDDDKSTDTFNYYDYFINKYYLYNTKNNPKPGMPDDIDRVAKLIFKHYINGTRLNYNELKPFRKLKNFVYKKSKNNVSFIHHTFFEYFIAKHTINLLKDIGRIDLNDWFFVFSKESNNDLSDIIRDGINSLEEKVKQRICANLLKCYEQTLTDDLKIKLSEVESIRNILLKSSPIQGNNDIACSKQKFILKMELILRISRIYNLSSDYVEAQKDFLKFIYENDEVSIADGETKTYEKENEYFKVVLKRLCAIGASLLGESELEIDYVGKMIKNPGDDNLYDLANRSNTMIYYCNVGYKNLFEFKDKNHYADWKLAGEKRLIRLRRESNVSILNIPVDMLNDRQKKELNDYRFRLFDLATVYTFLLSRKDSIKGWKSEYSEYHDVIKNLNLDYSLPIINSDSEKNEVIKRRIDLMKDIKFKIQLLF